MFGARSHHDVEAALGDVTEETFVPGPVSAGEGGMIVVLVNLDGLPVPLGTQRPAGLDLRGGDRRLAVPSPVDADVDGGSDDAIYR